MKNPLRPASEEIARRSSRRGFLGRSLNLAFGALAGTAAGAGLPRDSTAVVGTSCNFPKFAPCPCDECARNDGIATGVCGKPCVIWTSTYASGCWVAGNNADIICCDCVCPTAAGSTSCGCGSDYHNDPEFCP